MEFVTGVFGTSMNLIPRLFILTALSLSNSVLAQQNTDDQDAGADIERLIANYGDAHPLSGVILVARKEQILFNKAFGFADWELHTANTRNTRFGIASITKSLTEILVDILVEEGRLDLDASVATYIPDFPNGPEGGVPTVIQLLEHRAGVPHRVTTPVEESQPLRASDIVSRIRETELLFEPGTQRQYSSAGFTSLARVIELAANRSFESVLTEYVLIPAGMTSTLSETGQRLMDGRARPYRLGASDGVVVVKNAPYKDLRFLTGAGSVYSTADDLLKFIRAIKNGLFGDVMWKQLVGDDSASWRGITGRTNGYEASVDILADEDLTFIFLSNIQSASNWQIRAQIQEILMGREAPLLLQPPPIGEEFEDKKSILGTYGGATITLVDDTLFRGDNEFYPVAGGGYYIPASGSTMRFRRNSLGLVDALVSINGSGREVILPKSDNL